MTDKALCGSCGRGHGLPGDECPTCGALFDELIACLACGGDWGSCPHGELHAAREAIDRARKEAKETKP